MGDRSTYTETFDDGPGGWISAHAGGNGIRPLEVRDGVARSTPPWGVDFNHAPPGAGYLQLPFVIYTLWEKKPELSGVNRFHGHDTDLRNAELSVRIRGDLEARGAQLVVLVQMDLPRENATVRPNFILTGQPIPITSDWSEHTVTLSTDPGQWTCLGTRGPGADCSRYGEAPIEQVLADVNIDLMLVLFGFDPQPVEPLSDEDRHRLRAGKDYAVNPASIPDGWLELDTISIRYPTR
jgi:hypothetical protein